MRAHFYGYPYLLTQGLKSENVTVEHFSLGLKNLFADMKKQTSRKESTSLNDFRIELIDMAGTQIATLHGNTIYLDKTFLASMADIVMLICHSYFIDERENIDYFAYDFLHRACRFQDYYFQFLGEFYRIFEHDSNDNKLCTFKANIVSSAIMIFLIYHELAHAILPQQQKSGNELDNIVQEFAADIKAYQLFADYIYGSEYIKEMGVDIYSALWAPLLLFDILNTLDYVNYKLQAKNARYSYYADPIERQHQLFQALQQNFELIPKECFIEYINLIDFFKLIENLFSSGQITATTYQEYIDSLK